MTHVFAENLHFGLIASAAALRLMAFLIALNNRLSSIGFVKNSTAPAFIAWTVIGMSPWPVIKMIGHIHAITCGEFL